MIENQTFNSLAEVAEYMHTTRQAVYQAIKRGLLKAYKDDGQWRTTTAHITAYLEDKFNRDKRKDREGRLYFDIGAGYFSVKHAQILLSERLGYTPMSRMYYLVRVGILKATKKGAAWVIMRAEMERYLNEHEKECKEAIS